MLHEITLRCHLVACIMERRIRTLVSRSRRLELSDTGAGSTIKTAPKSSTHRLPCHLKMRSFQHCIRRILSQLLFSILSLSCLPSLMLRASLLVIVADRRPREDLFFSFIHPERTVNSNCSGPERMVEYFCTSRMAPLPRPHHLDMIAMLPG